MAGYFKRNPHREASYHRAIGRDGAVVEMVALGDTAWHAGDGKAWDGRRVNDRSVGLCLCLRGYVSPAWAATHPDRVLRADHLKPNVRSVLWEKPTPAQVLALRAQIAEVVAAQPSIRYVFGHDDVTAGKIDPGPILDGVDLGLEALGLRRVRRRWDLPGAPWEGLDAPAAPTAHPAPVAPPRARSAPTPAAPDAREYAGPLDVLVAGAPDGPYEYADGGPAPSGWSTPQIDPSTIAGRKVDVLECSEPVACEDLPTICEDTRV